MTLPAKRTTIIFILTIEKAVANFTPLANMHYMFMAVTPILNVKDMSMKWV